LRKRWAWVLECLTLAGGVRFAMASRTPVEADEPAYLQFVYGPARTLYGPEETVRMARAVTGCSEFTLEELLRIGERRLNMLRWFNAREGLDRWADQLPKKFLETLQGTGPTAGVALSREEIPKALDRRYEMAGWTREGALTSEKLRALGLGGLLTS